MSVGGGTFFQIAPHELAPRLGFDRARTVVGRARPVICSQERTRQVEKLRPAGARRSWVFRLIEIQWRQDRGFSRFKRRTNSFVVLVGILAYQNANCLARGSMDGTRRKGPVVRCYFRTRVRSIGLKACHDICIQRCTICRRSYCALRHLQTPIQFLRSHSLGCLSRMLLGFLDLSEPYLAVVRACIHSHRPRLQSAFTVSLSTFNLASSRRCCGSRTSGVACIASAHAGTDG